MLRKKGMKNVQIVKRTDENVEINLVGVLQLFWNKIWIILFACVACMVVVFAGLHLFVTPKYTAFITLYVNNNINQDTTSITQSDLTASAKLVDTYSAIISSSTMLDEVVHQANVQLDGKELKDMISTKSVNDTEVFTVSVEDTDPGQAALLANTIADVAPAQIAEIVEGSSVKVIARAEIPTEISSPSYLKFTALGGILGILISCAMILIRELTDTSIKSEGDLEMWNIPVLCVIPEFDQAQKETGYGYGYASAGSARKSGGKR